MCLRYVALCTITWLYWCVSLPHHRGRRQRASPAFGRCSRWAAAPKRPQSWPQIPTGSSGESAPEEEPSEPTSPSWPGTSRPGDETRRHAGRQWDRQGTHRSLCCFCWYVKLLVYSSISRAAENWVCQLLSSVQLSSDLYFPTWGNYFLLWGSIKTQKTGNINSKNTQRQLKTLKVLDDSKYTFQSKTKVVW